MFGVATRFPMAENCSSFLVWGRPRAGNALDRESGSRSHHERFGRTRGRRAAHHGVSWFQTGAYFNRHMHACTHTRSVGT